MLENLEKKLGIIFCLNKYRLEEMKFQEDGPLNLLILLIK